MSISHLVPQINTFYHFTNEMVINFQSVNQNEDHIRILFDVAKFFIANFGRVKGDFDISGIFRIFV